MNDVSQDNIEGASVAPVERSVARRDRYTSGRYIYGISPLMVRIMLVNMMALITLAGGILYLNQFRDNLIVRQIANISTQAEIIAGALGEAAVPDSESTVVDVVPARKIIARLIGPTEQYALLFRPEGTLIADSRYLAGNPKVVVEELPRLGNDRRWKERGLNAVYWLLDWFATNPDVPRHVDRQGMRAVDFIEVEQALTGQRKVQIRERSDGRLVINVAVPIQRFRRVLGALLVTAQTDDIEVIVREEQVAILQVFLVSITGTILLSLFLGSTIAKPIRILARAADRVRRGIGREEHLPEFSNRNDEIGDLSRALSDMTRALYNQIDAIEHFAADVSHELKNPLSSMRSALETIQMTKDASVQARLLAILNDDVRRLDRLITDISDASRLDAELTRGQMGPVDLSKMFATLLDAYNATACAEGPKLIINGGKKLKPRRYVVPGIEARLGQVWRNLIDNAITFTPKDKSIHIDLRVSGKMIIVEVCDEGPGLTEGAEHKIFERFYSERPEEEQFGNHSGLGLAISKQVIEAHCGSIVASNMSAKASKKLGINGGACFTVTVPIYKNRNS